MRFAFIARHRGIWPVAWLCEALDVSRSGFHAWLNRSPSARSRQDVVLVTAIDRSFKSRDRTYGARRVWHDVLADGLSCGLHRIERLMRDNGLRARLRRRGLPKDIGERAAVADNLLDRSFEASAPNRKWIADFTYIWTAEGWLYIAAVVGRCDNYNDASVRAFMRNSVGRTAGPLRFRILPTLGCFIRCLDFNAISSGFPGLRQRCFSSSATPVLRSDSTRSEGAA
jgi:hypothetical protein